MPRPKTPSSDLGSAPPPHRAGFFIDGPGTWLRLHAEAVHAGMNTDERRTQAQELVDKYKYTGWQKIKQLWNSYKEFVKETGTSLPTLCDAACLAFARWRERKHTKKQRKNGALKKQAGTTISSTVGQLLSCHNYFNGRTADPAALTRAAGAGGGFSAHKKAQSQKHKRSGGESFAIEKNAIDAAVTACMLAGSPRWLRTSGLIIAMAAGGGARFDDLRKMDVAATVARLQDGGDGSSLQFADGTTFANAENYRADKDFFQIAVGSATTGEFGKHRRTVVWKDVGTRGGTVCRMFQDWYENGPQQSRAESPSSIIFFPGKFAKRAGRGNAWGVNNQGFPTHYSFDHTTDMGTSKSTWLRDVFSPLCFEEGSIDPALMATKLGASLAAGSFHGIRRGTASAAEAAKASRLALQRLLGHKNDDTQDGYKELSATERMAALQPNEVTLGKGAKLPGPPSAVRAEEREAAEHEAFVTSAVRLTAIAAASRSKAGKAQQGVGPGGYAAIISTAAGGARETKPVFVLFGAAGSSRVLLLRERTVRVVPTATLSRWPAPPEGPAKMRRDDRSQRPPMPPPPARPAQAAFAAFLKGLGKPALTRPTSKGGDGKTSAVTAPRARSRWKLGEGIRQGFGTGAANATCFPGTVRWFTGVAECQYFNVQEQRWNTRFRFEDGETNDLNDDEIQKCISEGAVTRILARGDDVEGQPTWTTFDRGGTNSSPVNRETLDRSVQVGAEKTTPAAAWRGTWRLRQRADGSRAPCMVRGVMMINNRATGNIFITCPFQGTAGVIRAADTLPWTAQCDDTIWDEPAQPAQ